jgi:hypothetical protein
VARNWNHAAHWTIEGWIVALSKLQEIALHQILEVPIAPMVSRIVGEDGLVVEQRDVSDSIRQAKRALDEYLARIIYSDPATEAALKVYLDRWIALGTDTTVMESGTVGNVSGLSYNPTMERQTIKELVGHMVPFYRRPEEILRAQRNNTTVMILR